VPQTVTVTNTTGTAITFAANLNDPAVKAGADAVDFNVLPPTQGAPPPAPQLADCAGATVNPAATCGFDITFAPAAVPKAARAATLLLAPTAAAPALENPPPVTMNLSGTATVLVTIPAIAHANITPGTQEAGAGTTLDIVVTPTNAKFKVKEVVTNGITLLGAPATPTTLPNTPPFTLSAGVTNQAITVALMPSGDLDANGALEVGDAVKALKIVAGLQAPDGDDPDNTAVKVAPLVGGKPTPDLARATPSIGDVLVLLRRVVNLDTW
jgi:hypothetical protein